MIVRSVLRLACWTIGWTLFQWWAVVGWPATLDEAHFVLMVACGGSTAGLTAWYAVNRIANWPVGLR